MTPKWSWTPHPSWLVLDCRLKQMCCPPTGFPSHIKGMIFTGLAAAKALENTLQRWLQQNC